VTDEIAKSEPLDITSEQFRIYAYADGGRYRINCPDRLFVMPNGSHRVIDGDGMVHRPTPGWLAISWKPKPGAPEFIA
jgi:hypothetical protein